jgi:hypothetical protein
MQWTGALLLARHFQITSIEFEVFRFRPSESSMLGAASQFCACAALCARELPVRHHPAAGRSRLPDGGPCSVEVA